MLHPPTLAKRVLSAPKEAAKVWNIFTFTLNGDAYMPRPVNNVCLSNISRRGLKMSHQNLMFGLLVAAAWATPVAAATDSRSKVNTKSKGAVLQPAGADQIAAADRVLYGRYVCEFNQVIDIDRKANQPGYISLRFNQRGWTMRPVVSPSGAIRMEDVNGVTLMLQIANKSMLMNTKSGQRLVDGCVTSGQRSATLTRPTTL